VPAVGEPSHDEYQAQILQLAAIHRWQHLHVRKSQGRRAGGRAWQTTTNRAGWPDLLLWHEADQRRVALEVKVGRDKATPEQEQVLAELLASGMVEAAEVVYPADFDTVVVPLLQRRRRQVTPAP
jgi:hypothetical protein